MAPTGPELDTFLGQSKKKRKEIRHRVSFILLCLGLFFFGLTLSKPWPFGLFAFGFIIVSFFAYLAEEYEKN